MLNKELLLIPSLTEKDLEYSHTIIVGQDSDKVIGFSVNKPAFGSLTPNTFLNMEIRGILSKSGTAMTLSEVATGDKVYIGRTDTKKFVTLYYLGQGSSVLMTENNDDLFTDIDVGKEIKLWIADTPPPWT